MGGTDMFGRTVVNGPGGFSVVIGNGPSMVGLGVQLASSLLQVPAPLTRYPKGEIQNLRLEIFAPLDITLYT